MFAVRARTSPPRQMCHPAEHRSTAAHPFPDALAVSSSPVVAHEDVAVRPGDGKIPAAVHPPPHAAMFGNVVMLANASRVPSAHPIGDVGSWQIPPLQISLPVHACPQLPQFARSLPVVTHVPLQSVVPGGHDIARHVAPMQTCPEAQTVPHAPQFAGSVDTSNPLSTTPSQSSSAALQRSAIGMTSPTHSGAHAPTEVHAWIPPRHGPTPRVPAAPE